MSKRTRPTDITVTALPHPFRAERTTATVAVGSTLLEAIVAAGIAPRRGCHVQVWLGDQLVHRRYWHRVRPKAGVPVAVRMVPTFGGGGGGASGRKNAMRLVLSLAALAAGQVWGAQLGALLLGKATAATAIGGTTLGQLVGSGIISLTSQIAISALVKAPSPAAGGAAAGATDPLVPQITGTRNAASPFAPVPVVLGRMRLFPMLAARPYSEIEGSEQYLNLLFAVGHGPLRLSEMRIGETPLSEFEGVTVEVREGWSTDAPRSLFTTDVVEEQLATPLRQADGWITRRSATDADELAVDITFPGGLAQFPPQGRTWVRVEFDIEARDVSGGDWFRIQTLAVQEALTSAVRRTVRMPVKRGQYDVRVRRLTNDIDHDLVTDEAFWTALRSKRNRDPVRMTGLATVALRIRASNQLNGVIDTFSLLAESWRPVWNGAVWNWEVSRNAAWHYAWLFMGAANAEPVAADRMDLSSLLAWAGRNAAAGRTLDAVIEQPTTVFQLAGEIAAAGRARRAMEDGRYGVVEDLAQTVPVQMFGPRNSWGFTWEKSFIDAPHALRMAFQNAEANGQPDERIVYADGYSAANATRFESMSAWGRTDPAQVWKDGRYMIAQGVLRPETFRWNCDVESLVATYGSYVKIAHDVILVGLAQGRVKSVTLDGGGACTAVTVDEPCPMEAGKTYGLTVRRPDATLASRFVTRTVATAAGAQASLTFATPIAAGQPQPAAGDLFAFGESGLETLDVIVTDIERLDDYAAAITALPLAPAVHLADQGAIPAYTSLITKAARFEREPPAAPLVLGLASDESVLIGDSTPRILVSFVPRPGVLGAMVQARFRRTDTQSWLTADAPMETGEISLLPVDEGATYAIQLRASTLGLSSVWTAAVLHEVVGRRNVPADPYDARREGRYLVWGYGVRPRDFAGFRVKYRIGADDRWVDAVPAHEGLSAETRLDLGNLPRGQLLTLMVKAVDTAGNESASTAIHYTSVVQTVTQGDSPIANVVLTRDQAALGWPGTLSGGALDAGAAKANDTTQFWGPDDAPFWNPDPSAPFWDGLFTEMTYVVELTPDPALLPARLTVSADVAGESWSLEYRGGISEPFWGNDGDQFWGPDDDMFWEADSFWGADADPFWTHDGDPFWTHDGPFRPWPGAIDLTWQKYEILVRTAGGTVRGELRDLVLSIDVPDVAERVSAVALSAAGTRLPLARSYRTILSVRPTLRDDGGAAIGLRVVDRDPTLGPLVKAIDGLGAGTTALIDADITGY